MSAWVKRMCSSSCQSEYGRPSGTTLAQFRRHTFHRLVEARVRIGPDEERADLSTKGRIGHGRHGMTRHHRTRMTSDRVMMNVLSVLKSRTSTAGLPGVIIVDSRSTGVEMSTNGNAVLHDRFDRLALHGRIVDELLVQVQVVERADHAIVVGNGNLREVVLAHQRHGVLDRLVGLERAQLTRQPDSPGPSTVTRCSGPPPR